VLTDYAERAHAQGFRSTTVMALTDEVEDASPGNGNATGTGESCGWRPL
jgi:hypothetical protein